MPARVYATIGRASTNDVVLDDPTVSNHHARLSWSAGNLLVEDLSSENGTFVDGNQVTAATPARPGAELRCGAVTVAWSHPGLRQLLKAGTGSRTLLMPQASTPSYVCGACGFVGALQKPSQKTLTCSKCGATLRTRVKPRNTGGPGAVTWLLLAPLLAAAVLGGGWFLQGGVDLRRGLAPLSAALDSNEHVSFAAAQRIAKALTPLDPLTRNTAVKIAARTEGPFHVEQVAEIWNAVRGAWRYVNDPVGQDYFATAHETIDNGYVGDCDDFATTLASMVLAIGGKARVVIMDGPQGGHAYAEACVQGEPSKVAAALTKHYKARWSHYLAGRPSPRNIAFRTGSDCPIWLNLDWNSIVPGGAYQPENWAVAVYDDGSRQPLTAAGAVPPVKVKPVGGRGASASQ